MISVEKALSIYTDHITNGRSIEVEDFQDKMTKEEYYEFLELTGFTDLVLDTRSLSRYQKIFEDLNAFKESVYDIQSVANFRTDKGSPTDEAQKTIDKIFEEEFEDE